MNTKNFLTVSEFAKISGMSRRTLIYYDRIGLFSPAAVADNKYRMYTHSQVGIISLISVLSELGVPLKEIKETASDISPESAEKTLSQQLKVIEKKLSRLTLLNEMVRLRLEQVKKGEEVFGSGRAFEVKEVEEDVPFFIGKPTDCEKADISDGAVLGFLDDCEKRGIPLVFALGYVKGKETMTEGKTSVVRAMCFRLKSETYANGFMKRGKYAVGYAKGDYGKTDYIYKDLYDFLSAEGLKIAGDVYEEYLLDELTQNNPDDFVLQVSVPVEESLNVES